MDYWINGLSAFIKKLRRDMLDCCKSRRPACRDEHGAGRYAENNAFIIFKMPFFISVSNSMCLCLFLTQNQ